MLPLLLHFGMHDEKRIVWQVYGYLAFCVRIYLSACVAAAAAAAVFRHDSPDAKLACDAERDGPNDGSGP